MDPQHEALRYAKMQALRIKTLSAYKRKDWRKEKIAECGEKLSEVPGSMCFPYYADVMKLTEDRRIFLRESVAQAIYDADYRLQKQGLNLVVYDGWRSLDVQENLFWYYLKTFTVRSTQFELLFDEVKTPAEIKRVFLTLPPETQSFLKEANRKYVSWPSKDPEKPSPHATGGSADVWIRDVSGAHVNMGVPFDWMEENAGAFYHLKLRRKKFKRGDSEIGKYRTDLILAMCDSGFSCYGPEFWHFNLGNQMDAIVSGKTAKYSYIEP